MPFREKKPKGPKTAYLRRRYRKPIKHVPRSITPHQMVTLKTTFSNNTGWAIVYNSDKTATEYAFSGYKPIRVFSSDATPTHITEVEWNDGILTGLPSHYIQPPYESRLSDDASRAAHSNLMTNGRNLIGGGMIGSQWKISTNRFTWDSTLESATFVPVKKLTNFPCVSISDTTELNPVSYGFNLRETTYCTPAFMYGGNNKFTDDSFRRAYTDFILHSGSNAATGINVPLSDLDSTTLANTSAWELRSYLAKRAKVKVRNLVIRLPSEFQHLPNSEDLKSEDCILNGVDFSTAPWQEVVWDIIQADFMLVGDNQYGPPTKRNSDLHARINPKYKVLKDYMTVISVDGEPGRPNHRSYHNFHHNFETKYAMDHFKTQAPVMFHDDDLSSDLAVTDVSKTSGASITDDIGNITSIEVKADRQLLNTATTTTVPDGSSDNAATNIEGTAAVYNDMSTQANLANYVQNNGAAADVQQDNPAINPYTLFPSSNRIVHVRIPRYYYEDVELSDIAQGNFVYIPGIINTAPSNHQLNLQLDALCQLYTTIEGTSTYKFLRPEALGRKGLVLDGGETVTYETARWGDATLPVVVEN